MDDLISKKALLEDFRKTITESSDTFDWLNMINRQPTAYDVDKVVEKLGELQQYFIYSKENLVDVKEIIPIVKGGGVDE